MSKQKGLHSLQKPAMKFRPTSNWQAISLFLVLVNISVTYSLISLGCLKSLEGQRLKKIKQNIIYSVTLYYSLNFSEPKFLHQRSRNNTTKFSGLYINILYINITGIIKEMEAQESCAVCFVWSVNCPIPSLSLSCLFTFSTGLPHKSTESGK